MSGPLSTASLMMSNKKKKITDFTFHEGVYSGFYGLTHDTVTLNIGTPHVDRQVIVAVAHVDIVGPYVPQGNDQNGNPMGGGNYISCTIGGITATRIAAIGHNRGNDYANHCDLWIANVPTGTTAEIVLTLFSGTSNHAQIATYSCKGCSTVPYDWGNHMLGYTDDLIVSGIDVVDDGAIIGMCAWEDSAPDARSGSIASKFYSTGQTGLTIRADDGGAPRI